MAADWHCCGCDDPNNTLGCDNHDQQKCACFHCTECGSTEHRYPLPTCRHSGSGVRVGIRRFWIRVGNNSYCTQYGTLLIHSVAEMADGTVRWTFGTAADARTNRTWSAANTRRRSAALHALARWRTEPKWEGEAEAGAEMLLGRGITHAQMIFVASLREVFRIIISGEITLLCCSRGVMHLSWALQIRKFLSICS